MKVYKRISGILLAAIMVSVLAGCSQNAKEVAEVQLTPVETYKVVKGDIQAAYSLSGKIKPLKEIAVVPKLPGKVENVFKDIGDAVAEGEKLLTLETKELTQQLSQLEAQLLQSDAGIDLAQISLNRAQGSGLEQQLMQAEAALKQATLNYNTAKTDYESSQKLFDTQALSRQMLDATKDRLDLAELQRKNAQDSYDLLKNKISAESIDTAKSQVKQAQAGKAALQGQKEMLLQKIDDAVVTSPLKGIIAQKGVERGELASQQMPAYTVVDIDSVIVEVSVTEKIISSIAKGQEVVVTVKSLGDRKFKGVIDAMSPSVTAQSVGYPVKIIIENRGHEIKPGMFAQVEFTTEKKKGVCLVPMEAVLTDKGKNVVFILEGDTVKKREVTSGLKDGKNSEISGGLKEGEWVVVKGQQYVSDGEKVQPLGGAQ